MKVRQALRAVRDRLAVQDDPRQSHKAARMADPLGRPVAAVARPKPDLVAILMRECFSSWIQCGPTGTFSESTGWHGRMKRAAGADPGREANASTLPGV
jgi:hypothetical protein